MWLCLSLSNMIFTVQYGSLIHPSHVKVSRPKMPGNAFSSVWFSKIFPREYAPGPPKNGGLKPIICFPQNHNRLLLRKLWLIKSKENSRCSLFCSPKFPMWALCLINFVTNCTNGAFTAESLGKQTLQSLRSMWRFFVSVMTCTFCDKNRENFFKKLRCLLIILVIDFFILVLTLDLTVMIDANLLGFN